MSNKFTDWCKSMSQSTYNRYGYSGCGWLHLFELLFTIGFVAILILYFVDKCSK